MTAAVPVVSAGPDAIVTAADVFGRTWPQVSAAAGVVVSAAAARSVPAVAACERELVEPLQKAPLHVERVDGERRTLMADHPLMRLMNVRPNADQDAYAFRGQVVQDLVTHRSALVELGYSGSTLTDLVPVPWDEVSVERRRDGRRWYTYPHPWTGNATVKRDDEVWAPHTVPLRSDKLAGWSRIVQHRETFGTAIALEVYGARYFRNAGVGGIVEATFVSDDDRDNFWRFWVAARTGENAHRDALLEAGMKYHAGTGDNAKSQFVEARERLAVEIASIYGVPTFKVGDPKAKTYASLEQDRLDWVYDSLAPLGALLGWSLRRWLLGSVPNVQVTLDFSDLLRGDEKAMAEADAIGVNAGWLNRNEARVKRGLNPRPGLDVFREQMNTQPVNGGRDTNATPSGWRRTPGGMLVAAA